MHGPIYIKKWENRLTTLVRRWSPRFTVRIYFKYESVKKYKEITNNISWCSFNKL